MKKLLALLKLQFFYCWPYFIANNFSYNIKKRIKNSKNKNLL